jgi:hypothetical protein
MYTTFVRPILEYKSMGRVNQTDAEKLEKLQLNAARIVTSLPLLESRESLYFETGWEPLYIKRKHTRLKTIRKVNYNLAPGYILDIFPNIRSHASNYVTRNSQDYSIPKCRLHIYKNSFVSTAIQKWNALPLETRQSETLSKFIKFISNTTKSPPLYFSIGDRRLNIIHTRIRRHCILNKDLFRCNIIESP